MHSDQDFKRKTFGAIFVQKYEDIQLVRNLIKGLDSFEYEYLPEGLIKVYHAKPTLQYLGKFEMNKDDLIRACLNCGLWILCIDGREDEHDHSL